MLSHEQKLTNKLTDRTLRYLTELASTPARSWWDNRGSIDGYLINTAILESSTLLYVYNTHLHLYVKVPKQMVSTSLRQNYKQFSYCGYTIDFTGRDLLIPCSIDLNGNVYYGAICTILGNIYKSTGIANRSKRKYSWDESVYIDTTKLIYDTIELHRNNGVNIPLGEFLLKTLQVKS